LVGREALRHLRDQLRRQRDDGLRVVSFPDEVLVDRSGAGLYGLSGLGNGTGPPGTWDAIASAIATISELVAPFRLAAS
jgi:hypothetical protein